MIAFYVLLFLSSVLFFGIGGYDQWGGQLALLSVLIMLYYLGRRMADGWQDTSALVGAFGVWAVIVTHQPEALLPLFLFLVLYFELVRMKLDIGKTLNVICLMAIAQSGYVYVQMAGYEPLLRVLQGGVPPPLVGFMGNPNMLGAFLAFCLPAFFRRKWVYLLPIVLPALLFNPHTKGAVVSLSVGVLFWLINQDWSWKRKALIFLLPAILLGGYLAKSEWTSPPLRFQEYKKILYVSNHLTASNKFVDLNPNHNIIRSTFGYGIGSFKKFYPMIRNAWWKPLPENVVYGQAHNEFLQAKFELGWIGVVIIGFYLWGVYRKPHNLILTTALTIILVNSLINFPLHIAPIAILVIVYMAMRERG